MRRYSCFSVTGFNIAPGGSTAGNAPLRTTWYVCDNDCEGRVVFASPFEHEAREFCFQSNAEERAWEKQREHLIEDLLA